MPARARSAAVTYRVAMPKAHEIPRVNTPEGGWRGEMPEPILGACNEPPAPGVPDLRGTWRATEVLVNGSPAPSGHRMYSHVERIEQAGMRAVVTSDGIIHDFLVVDGTAENGCHDVAAMDFTTPIVVAGSYEDGALVMRPVDMPGVEVRRWRDGEHVIWDYHGAFTVRMARHDGN